MTRVVFMGTPDFAVPVLKALIRDGYEIAGVVTQPDRPVGRKHVLTTPPVKVEAEKHHIPVYQPEKLRLSESLTPILELKPDVVVTCAYGQILPKALLDAPPYGCINVHASLLPELRGGAPIHYAILQGKKKTGITIMYMAEKLDAGDIISQREVDIDETDDVGTLHEKLSAVGAELLSETLPKILAKEITAIPQDEEKATFAYNITRGQEKINWEKTGEDIYNQIRGLCPWPVAYTVLGGKTIKIWKSEKVALPQKMDPGVIVELQKDGIVVATGNTTGIKITELQPAGKKKMPAARFLNGAGSNFSAGMKFGEEDE
ncbi:methionyl-tRNA formyltransferase [Weizmannia acidilactici]|uniref:Methionyl-tRNA formyltransferase n=1 Tax=Weizmannia acidilactici TaxID=2607726 RepID=A0A5J4JN47_9BACI|nr:methionyl-tRNA formyltransferase [Weizmannia acidilactici]GER65575.1 methionyl-tRNA formyltransferase [Weizmannia acidilactici]GER70414.1 methionyl-tRNA formyltransferase [Weizmannia acidilactici]GER74115.1 methionyl-tRNA formyltransferase [Weizmannia acidilactici]